VGETPTEAEHVVLELLALLVLGEEFMTVALLEGSETAGGGAASLSPEDAHGEDVLARPLRMVGMVRAVTRLDVAAVGDSIEAVARAAGDQIEVLAHAPYVVTSGAVELEGALGAGGGLVPMIG